MKTFGDLFGDRGSGRGKVCAENQVRLGIHTETKRGGRKSMAIIIGREVMRDLRWVIGDKVTIRMDCARSEMLIVRVPESSSEVRWTLTWGDNSNGRLNGSVHRAHFSLNVTPVMLQAFGMDDTNEYIPSIHTTGEEGLRIPLRKPWTVVNR